MSPYSVHKVCRIKNNQYIANDDVLAEETAVALVYNGISHVVLMATPNDISELALGFSLSEGILTNINELYDLEVKTTHHGIEVYLYIASSRFQILKQKRRQMNGRTGCGLCGIESLAAIQPTLAQVARGDHIQTQDIQSALQDFSTHQLLRRQTGSVHGTAWVENGNIIELFEDVGRHNALDKLLGYGINAGINWQQGFVLISSRASYELVVKIATLGIGCLVAVSAPTALAVRLAEQAGISLVGFEKPEQFTVYTQASYIRTPTLF